MGVSSAPPAASPQRRLRWADPGPNVAIAIAVAFVCAVGVVRLLQIVQNGELLSSRVEGVAYLLAMVATQIAFSVLWSRRRLTPTTTVLLLGLEMILVVMPFVRFPGWWIGVGGFLAASLVLALRPSFSIPAAIFMVVATPGVVALADRSARQIRFGLASTGLALISVYGLTRLVRLMHDISATRDTLSRAARVHERRQLAEQLDSRLGASLAGIMSATRSAAASLATGPATGAPDLEKLVRMCRTATAEAREVAHQTLDRDPGHDATTQASLPAMPPRLARGIVATAVLFFGVMSLPLILEDHDLPATLFGVTCLTTLVALQLGYFSNPNQRPGGRIGVLALLAQASLVFIPLTLFGFAWGDYGGFLGASLLLTLPAEVGIPLAGLVAIAAGLPALPGLGLFMMLSMIASNVATTLVVYGLTRLARLARELRTASQHAIAAAANDERVRLSRDIHDLLGLSLSAMTLKAELASRLVQDQPAAVATELEEITTLARDGIAEVRDIPEGGPPLALADEIDFARAALTAANVALEIHSLPADLPEPNATTLATVVREGVTNVLRHSTASRCAISISNTQTGIGLRIVNDGISHPTDHQPGNGIDNLRSRVGSVGGTFQAGVEPGGTFSLVAELPAG